MAMAIQKNQSTPTMPTIDKCESTGRENHTVVTDMDGTLLRGHSSFPYFALVAFEVGGILRLLFLFLASPLAGLLYYFISESAGIRVLIFTTFVGMKVSDIESVARAVLPKFYSSDLHPETWRVYWACGKRIVLTANPKIMVEPFLKEYLGADMVLGTEICVFKGRATGLVKGPGVLVGKNKADKLLKEIGDGKTMPEIGLGDRKTDIPFMALCKESYMVPPNPTVKAVIHDKLPKPIVFHDGRLVQKPTPFLALLIILWIPVGFLLACLRVAAGTLLPLPLVYYAFCVLGVRIHIKGTPPAQKSIGQSGVLYICCHRTVLDAVFLSAVLGRPIPTVTYSISRFTEFISPIKTVRLSRDRATDAFAIKKQLEEGDLTICPEGTTCREPFLLRFSALFAELTDELVPVAISNRMSMFYGTTVRGCKAMDPFYFFMNPCPVYEITFLSKLPYELTCGGGKSSHEVANYMQRIIAASLSYECTSFTRRDKYRALAGNDGRVRG